MIGALRSSLFRWFVPPRFFLSFANTLQWLRAEISRQPRSKWPQLIKNNRTSPAWGRNLRKWREMEKALGEGENWSRQEPILAPIVNIDNIWWQIVKNRIWKFFFSLFAPSMLTNKLIFFFSFKKWELRSPRIFFQISRIPLIFRPNIPYPYNFLPKYPVSL